MEIYQDGNLIEVRLVVTRSEIPRANIPSIVCRTVAEAADRSYAYVIVTTKAIPDVMRTPELLAPFLAPEYVEKYQQPTYVMLQNGLNVETDLFRAVKALGKT